MLPSRVRVRDQDDTIPLAHIAVGVETGGWTDPSLFPLMIMQTLLGSWNRSHPGGANVASPLCRVRRVGCFFLFFFGDSTRPPILGSGLRTIMVKNFVMLFVMRGGIDECFHNFCNDFWYIFVIFSKIVTKIVSHFC